MEAIDTKAIKDAVAKKHGYKTFNEFLFDNWLHDQEMNEVIDEVISEVAKQVAEATKQSCAKKYKNECTSFFDYNLLAEQAILNAPIPEII